MAKISTTLQRRPTWRLNAKLVPYVLLAPFVVLFLIFGLFPLVFSLFLAFQSWEPTSCLATMDGANQWKQFWYITLPSLKPMIFFGVTLSLIGGLQLFEEPFILTGGRGGSDQAGMTTAMYMYRTAFDFNDFGTASALSWILFIFVAVLTWLTNLAFKPKGGEA